MVRKLTSKGSLARQRSLELSMEPKVVWDLKDLCHLFLLKRERGSKELRRVLEKRARKVVQFWIRWLGGNNIGRPRDQKERAQWRTLLALKNAGNPLSKVFRTLVSHGYSDSDIDRLRKGVERLEKEIRLDESRRKASQH